MIMKYTILFLIAMMFTLSSFEQINKPPATRDDYLKRSDTQKAFGWIFLGGGMLTTAEGISITFANSIVNTFSSSKDHRGVTVTIIGMTISLSSIPFFAAGHKNKLRAANMSINQEAK